MSFVHLHLVPTVWFQSLTFEFEPLKELTSIHTVNPERGKYKNNCRISWTKKKKKSKCVLKVIKKVKIMCYFCFGLNT